MLMFGICVFMLKWPPPIISSQLFSDESRREQAEKVFDSVRDLMRTKLLTTLCNGPRARAFRSHGQRHRDANQITM
jgi:hypothetical protein